jgi:hypothetical protein
VSTSTRTSSVAVAPRGGVSPTSTTSCRRLRRSLIAPPPGRRRPRCARRERAQQDLELGDGVGEVALDRARGEAEALGDLGHREVVVVAQDDARTQAWPQHGEGGAHVDPVLGGGRRGGHRLGHADEVTQAVPVAPPPATVEEHAQHGLPHVRLGRGDLAQGAAAAERAHQGPLHEVVGVAQVAAGEQRRVAHERRAPLAHEPLQHRRPRCLAHPGLPPTPP